jgi:hypothetical protein
MGVGDNQIYNVGLLRCLCQQLLELKPAPVHAHHAHHPCPGSRFKRPYQGCALFQQQFGGEFLFSGDVLKRYENKDGHQDHYCAQNDPWRYAKPAFLFSAIFFHEHHTKQKEYQNKIASRFYIESAYGRFEKTYKIKPLIT